MSQREPKIGVWIFLDDSNLWIEGKKLRGSLINNKYFKEDPRGRVSLQMLERFILDGRKLESAILYGSEPPAVETYWRHAERKGWKVNPFQRSMHNKKEKEVDCAISVDITKTVYQTDFKQLKYKDGNRVIVLVSGDKDMRPAVNEVLSQNGRWKLELVSYKHSMSNELTKLASNHPDIVTIRFLDSNQITFIQLDIKMTDIRDGDKYRFGIVFCDVGKGVEEELLSSQLEKLKWPYQKKWLNDRNGSRHYFVIFSSPDQERDSCPVDMPIDSNLKLLRNDPLLKGSCSKITTYQEFKKHREFIDSSPLDISNKFDILSLDEAGDHSVNGFKIRGINNNFESPADSSVSYDDDSLYDDSFGSVNGEEMYDSSTLSDTYVVNGDAGNGGAAGLKLGAMTDWNSVNLNQRSRKKGQMFTKLCDYGFMCRQRRNCHYKHTTLQIQYFKTNMDTPNFKTKICNKLPYCPYGPICLFAHSESELQCTFCGQTGHVVAACSTRENAD